MALRPDEGERFVLAQAHAAQRRQAALARRVGDTLARAFRAVALTAGVDGAALSAWLTGALALVEGGQRAAVQLAIAEQSVFAAVLADTEIAVGRLPDLAAVTGSALRSGTAMSEVYARPMGAARAALATGLDLRDAVEQGAAKAAALGRTDVANATRVGGLAAMRATPGCTSYRRIPGRAACPFCLTIASRTYGLTEQAPAHTNCTCGQAPIFGRDLTAAIGERAEKGAAPAAPVVDTEAGPST